MRKLASLFLLTAVALCMTRLKSATAQEITRVGSDVAVRLAEHLGFEVD